MTNVELKKYKLIKSLWEIVKLANDEEIAEADLFNGIPDGETPEENLQMVVDDFKSCFSLYAPLAISALRSGIYFGLDGDDNVYFVEKGVKSEKL